MKLHSIPLFSKIKSKSRTESVDSRLIHDILRNEKTTARHKRRELTDFKINRMKSLVENPMDMKKFSLDAQTPLMAVYSAASALYDMAYLGIVKNTTTGDMGL